MNITGQERAEEAVPESGAIYCSLMEILDQGCCVIEVLFEQEQPVDYRFLETNPSFNEQTGLAHPRGKRMRDLSPQHEQHWFDAYGRAALTGEVQRFQNDAVQPGRRYEVFAFRVGKPADHHVAVVFTDITAHKQTEQALQASERRLRSIMDQLPAGVGIMDKTGAWLLTNAQMEKLSPSALPGQTAEGVTDPTWDEHGIPILPEQWPSRRALRGETVIPAVETRHVGEAGETWTRVSAAPLRDDTGNLVGATAMVYDITHEKQAEQALRRNAETFATLVEQSPLGIYSVDSQFRIRHVSAGAMPAFRNVQPLIGRDFAEVMHTLWPDSFANEAIQIFRRTLETGEPYLSPGLTNVRKDIGAIESYEWQTIRVTLADGQYGVVCYYFDTTRLQQANQNIRESEARFRALASATKDSVYRMNADWSEMRHLAGRQFNPDEGHPGGSWMDRIIPAEDHPDVLENIRRAIDSKSVFELEHRVIQTNGKVGWAYSRAIPILDEQGEIREWFGAASDATERKEIQDRLEQFTEELEAQVTHRTAELLQSQAQLRALGTELNLAEHRERQRLAEELHDHLQQLLVLGKLTIGQHKRRGTTDSYSAEAMAKVDDLLSDALNYTRTLVAELSPPVLTDHGLAAGLRWLGNYMKKHELTVTVLLPAEQMPALPADQDMMIFQSVRELLINCSKHAGTGQASVMVEKQADLLCIKVIDQGVGFERAANAPTGELSSKFGLFSIRERMRALGGSLSIQSAPGMGTTATLRLPLTPKPSQSIKMPVP